MSPMPNHPVLFAFGLHAHQPVGNFDHVFREHLDEVYRPFLALAVEEGLLPLTLHLSGPLLDWLEANDPKYLDLIGKLVDEGGLELLLAGYYEPILPALLREDRVEQVGWMQEALLSRFGVRARGLWLTERVWEPDLAEDLGRAGVEYLLVDDRHFVAAGFDRDQLHQPYLTEAGGQSLSVFAIDERLRYFLPFHAPEDTVAYLRTLRASGKRLAVAADDIEKFGGWPGTREWVYDRGWLRRFILALKTMEEAGEVRLSTFSQALEQVPSGGPAYLPSSSYREMEEWALPPDAFRRMTRLKEVVEEGGFDQGASPLVRGSHWRNFLVKYSEANRMHKKGMALSLLSRERGNPAQVRRSLGAAQCNDAYWHGVFGGLYLRHLRDAIWRKLAEAEGALRKGEGLGWETRDMDLDGKDEVWFHSEAFSAVVSPARGGAIEELTFLHAGVNLANSLTRRREAYHELSGEAGASDSSPQSKDESTTPSIHDIEGELRFLELPPVDSVDRGLFQERVLPASLDLQKYRTGNFSPLRSWAERPLTLIDLTTGREDPGADGPEEAIDWVEVSLGDPENEAFEKRIRFGSDGAVEVFFQWEPGDFPETAYFTTELSLGADADLVTFPETECWRFPISTFSKSERGFDETVQGESVTVRWPCKTGWGRILLTLRPRP